MLILLIEDKIVFVVTFHDGFNEAEELVEICVKFNVKIGLLDVLVEVTVDIVHGFDEMLKSVIYKNAAEAQVFSLCFQEIEQMVHEIECQIIILKQMWVGEFSQDNFTIDVQISHDEAHDLKDLYDLLQKLCSLVFFDSEGVLQFSKSRDKLKGEAILEQGSRFGQS